MGQKSAVEALNDLELLFRYLDLYGVMDKVRKYFESSIEILNELISF